MKMRIIVVLLVISVAMNLGIAYTILASGSGNVKNVEKNGDHCSWTHNPVCPKLNLTDDQIQKLEESRKNFQHTILPLKENLKQERQKLFSHLKKEQMDQIAIEGTQKKICSLQGRIQKHFISHFSHIRKIFTTDQQRQFYFYFEQGLCTGKATKRKTK